uniref:Probable G-protein coupled receptor 174 n=1 Tax=Oryzias latipes TaxID=8090 RepID=A0A3P9MIC2_ORYLA
MNETCNDLGLKDYQHRVYAVVYSVILAPGLIFNILALWVFKIYIKETKKAVLFMMNLALSDLLQVLSLPLRIYYYLNRTWPFGHFLCMACFYVKYVNMYASIFFLTCISVRRCQLIKCPLIYNSSKKKGDLLVCGLGWLVISLFCLAFPLLRYPSSDSGSNQSMSCFSELPMKNISAPTVGVLLVLAELGGFIIPLIVVLVCACYTAGSLRETTAEAIRDKGEKKRALRMVLSCTIVFLVCFAPYHVTLPLDFLAKSNSLGNCSVMNFIKRCHTLTLCLASLNCSLDPLMYYFTTYEFWRRLRTTNVSESNTLHRQTSCISGGDFESINVDLLLSPMQTVTPSP